MPENSSERHLRRLVTSSLETLQTMQSVRKGVNVLISFSLSLIPYQYTPWPNTPRSHKAREPVHTGPPLAVHLQSRLEKGTVDLGR